MQRIVEGRKKIKQGGFSDQVFQQYELQSYIKTPYASGYIGAYNRTATYDRLVEKYLRAKGLGPRAIAMWLTSTSGRHLMDDPSIKHLKANLAHADVEVVCWADERHRGTLASSMEIEKTLTPEEIKHRLYLIG